MALGTKHHGIYTVADVKSRCRMVDGHWLWAGAVTVDGITRMWAPRAKDGKQVARNGPCATWELHTGKPVPEGCKVFRTCGEHLCVNPDHLACRTTAEQGRIVARMGTLKGLPSKIAANRKTSLARSKVTPEIYEYILTADKTGELLGEELGIGRSTISRIRTGQFKTMHRLVGSPFAGLGARGG